VRSPYLLHIFFVVKCNPSLLALSVSLSLSAFPVLIHLQNLQSLAPRLLAMALKTSLLKEVVDLPHENPKDPKDPIFHIFHVAEEEIETPMKQ
jgi:hypothetical protein